MAIDKDRLKEDATNILKGIGKFTPGGILKDLIGGNEGEILKVIRTILSGTAPGRAAEAVQILVDRYKLPESVAKRIVANEMTDANMPVDLSGSADEGFPSRPEFESSAEDTSVPSKRKRPPTITLEMLEDLLKNNKRKVTPLPEPRPERFPDEERFYPEGPGRFPDPSRPFIPKDIMPELEGVNPEDNPMFIGPTEKREGILNLLLRLMRPGPMRNLANGGRVSFQTGGVTESRTLPPEFVEAAQKTFLTDLSRQAGIPTITTAIQQQPGETAEQFANRQAQATTVWNY